MTSSPETNALRAQDAAARRAARTVFDRTVVLEAGAGTGKTTALVARVIAWLVEPGFARAREQLSDASDSSGTTRDALAALRALERVIAITFTEAAAAEMDARIRASLAQLEAGATPTGLEEHAWTVSPVECARRAGLLRRALERPIAQTIHAWCQRLLAEHPLEAGLQPGFEVDADGLRVAEIARDVVERALGVALADAPDPRWIVLGTRGVGPADLQTALMKLAAEAVRAADLARDPFPIDALVAIEVSLARNLAHFLDGCRAPLVRAVKGTPIAGEVLTELTSLLTAFVREPVRTKAEATARCRDAAKIDTKILKRLADWSSDDFGKNETRDIGEDRPRVRALAAELRPELARYQRLDPELTDAARSILGELLGELRRLLVARGIETFGDLLHDARALLQRDAPLCRRLRARLDQVLVDEFQDTDPIQCEIVRALALDPEHGPPIGLFLVGDPKQSIYGFRRADLAAYDAFVRAVLGPGGAPLRLSVNFRSTQRILDEVARAVAPVMRAEIGVQPAFQPLLAHRTDDGPAVEAWFAWDLDATQPPSHEKTTRDRAARAEGRTLAAALFRSHASGVKWHDMAVLVRTTGALDVLLDELRALAIPFDVAGDKGYYRRREIIDAASLLACVADPSDALSLFAFLRSPIVGAPDALLYRLWHTDFPARMRASTGVDAHTSAEIVALVRAAITALPTDVPGLERIAGFEHALVHAIECLAVLRASLARDAADVFVERLRTMLLVEPTEASRYLGRYRLANLERFFARIQDELDRSGGDARSLLRFLRTAIDSAQDETEAKPRDTAASAVAVMTIHKAKGLDFREVFVVDLHRGSKRQDHGRRVEFAADAREFNLFGAPTPGWCDVEERARTRESAERVRLLYVAMTRAKDRLVLSGTWNEPTAPRPVANCTSMIEVLAGFVEPAALVAARIATFATPSPFTAGTLTCVLPPPPHAPGAVVHVEGTAPPTAGIDRTVLDAEANALESRRERALQRQGCPLHAAASARIARDEDGEVVPIGRSSTRSESSRSEERSKVSSSVASIAGTAIHRLLEEVALVGDVNAALRARGAALERYVDTALRGSVEIESSVRAAALAHTQTLFDAFVTGPIAARFAAIADQVIARELPLLIAPGDHDEAIEFLSGSIDLLYRDRSTGEFVVVDYKTDSVADADDLARHVARHRLQIDRYRGAVRDALALERLPRAELWFLAAAHIENIA